MKSVDYCFSTFLDKGRKNYQHHISLQVRNKVDDRIYALKRIQLDQQSEVVRRKIIREVKLLSSLNHENVVRYYTSWIDEFEQVSNFLSNMKMLLYR